MTYPLSVKLIIGNSNTYNREQDMPVLTVGLRATNRQLRRRTCVFRRLPSDVYIHDVLIVFTCV